MQGHRLREARLDQGDGLGAGAFCRVALGRPQARQVRQERSDQRLADQRAARAALCKIGRKRVKEQFEQVRAQGRLLSRWRQRARITEHGLGDFRGDEKKLRAPTVAPFEALFVARAPDREAGRKPTPVPVAELAAGLLMHAALDAVARVAMIHDAFVRPRDVGEVRTLPPDTPAVEQESRHGRDVVETLWAWQWGDAHGGLLGGFSTPDGLARY